MLSILNAIWRANYHRKHLHLHLVILWLATQAAAQSRLVEKSLLQIVHVYFWVQLLSYLGVLAQCQHMVSHSFATIQNEKKWQASINNMNGANNEMLHVYHAHVIAHTDQVVAKHPDIIQMQARSKSHTSPVLNGSSIDQYLWNTPKKDGWPTKISVKLKMTTLINQWVHMPQ